MESPPQRILGGLFCTGTPPTFPVGRIAARKNPTRHVRAAWVSDVHLGTRGSNAQAFLEFLREHEFETLYIVGDLIDIWQLRRARYWPQEHNDVIQKILRKARALFTSQVIMMSFSPIFTAATATSRSRNMPFIGLRTGVGSL